MLSCAHSTCLGMNSAFVLKQFSFPPAGARTAVSIPMQRICQQGTSCILFQCIRLHLSREQYGRGPSQLIQRTARRPQGNPVCVSRGSAWPWLIKSLEPGGNFCVCVSFSHKKLHDAEDSSHNCCFGFDAN